MTTLEDEIDEVLRAFPLLKKINNNLVKGKIEVKRFYNDVPINIDYEIEINIPDNYPKKFPTVREIGEKISLGYSHIYNNRELCLATDADMKISLYPSYKLVDFLNNYVISFLYTHSYFLKYNVLPFGERSHGVEGILEFYIEYFNLKNKKQVRNLLGLISMKNCKGHLFCYCGSEKKIRDCHRDEIYKLRNSDFIDIYRQDFKVIINNEVRNVRNRKKAK